MKKIMILLFAFAFIIGCSDNQNSPVSSSKEQAQSCLAGTPGYPQAFPGQVGVLDSGYFRGNKIYFSHIHGVNVFQGDIILPGSLITKEPGLSKTGAIRTDYLWPSSTVYYTINSDLPDQARVTGAFTQWTINSNLNFVPRTNQTNYIRFQWDPSGCWSTGVGMLGGEQIISLADWGTTGNVVHEIGHGVNLFHEHTRTDGDLVNINVKWTNICHTPPNDWWPQFYMYTTYYNDGANNGSYDYNSIMHYPCYTADVAHNGCAINSSLPIITKLDGTIWTNNTTAVSNGDIQAVNFLYAPSRPQNRGSALLSNQYLRNGDYLQSSNGRYRLYLQTDGNLVLYNWSTQRYIWTSWTNGKPVVKAIMQGDGNFVEYSFNNASYYWRSNTGNHPGAWLSMQSDGNLVIYSSSNSALWWTGTAGK
jgi:hypothetical protein